MIYSTEQRPKLSSKISFGESGKKLGEQWRAMSDTKRKKYEKAAEADKERYKKEMSKYKPSAKMAKMIADFQQGYPEGAAAPSKAQIKAEVLRIAQYAKRPSGGSMCWQVHPPLLEEYGLHELAAEAILAAEAMATAAAMPQEAAAKPDAKELPPGWSGSQHDGPSSSYMVYHGPGGKKERSIAAAWRAHEAAHTGSVAAAAATAAAPPSKPSAAKKPGAMLSFLKLNSCAVGTQSPAIPDAAASSAPPGTPLTAPAAPV